MNLTPTMRDCLLHMLDDPDRVIYLTDLPLCPWTTPSTPLHNGSGLVSWPSWWVCFKTVRALEMRGLIETCGHRHSPSVKNKTPPRRLTARGVREAKALAEVSGGPSTPQGAAWRMET